MLDIYLESAEDNAQAEENDQQATKKGLKKGSIGWKLKQSGHGLPSWYAELKLNQDGTVKANEYNAAVVFAESASMKSKLAFDEFAQSIVWLGDAPWKRAAMDRHLNDTDLIEALMWTQRPGMPFNFNKNATDRAIYAVARRNSFHPVRQYLKGLKWDGKPRIDTVLIDHLGADDTSLNRAYGSKGLIGAVARVMQPGCFVKNMWALEGEQDLRKSTGLKALMPDEDWFTDHLEEIGSKDARMQLRGKWLIEFAELGSLGKADANKAKAFLSTTTDHYRLPWDKLPSTIERQNIFAVTVNPGAGGYLKDVTGNVRYWVIPCGVGWEPGRKIDAEAIASERDQLWAEAYLRYQADESWWLDTPELEAAAAEVAEESMQLDAWHDMIREFCAGKPAVTQDEILGDCLGIRKADWHYGHKTRVANVLTMLKWKRKQFRLSPAPKDRLWAYYPGGDHKPALEYLKAEKTRKENEKAEAQGQGKKWPHAVKP